MRKILLVVSLSYCLALNAQVDQKVYFDLTISLGSSVLVNTLSGTARQLSPFAQTNFNRLGTLLPAIQKSTKR